MFLWSGVAPLIVDSPKYGHSIVYLSTKDKTLSPSIIPAIHFEPPKVENLSTKNKSADFMSSPKCPLFRGYTVPHVVPKVSFIWRLHCTSWF